MSRAAPPEGRAGLIKTLQSFGYQHTLYHVWRDWLEMTAISFRNAVDIHGRDSREQRYLEVAKRYSREELATFARCIALLVDTFETEAGDVLGSIYMELGLGNKDAGQFFTPYSLCKMMAGIQIGDGHGLRGFVERSGFVTVHEPSVGGGAMLIAFAEAMRAEGFNPQQQMHATAIDVDLKAVHMSYIQLTLLHIPAVIVHGNALTLEEHDRWRTPAHILGGWEWRYRRNDHPAEAFQPETTPAPSTAPTLAEVTAPISGPLVPENQLSLF